MRPRLAALCAAATVLGAAGPAAAQLPPPPPLPPVEPPPLPVPLPLPPPPQVQVPQPAPAPAPAPAPVPAPVPAPSLPQVLPSTQAAPAAGSAASSPEPTRSEAPPASSTASSPARSPDPGSAGGGAQAPTPPPASSAGATAAGAISSAGGTAARPHATGARARARAARIVLGFRLRAAARVALPVVQVAPSCRRVGVLRVRGRAGVNRIRFDGRLHGRRLADGTYVVVAPSGTIRFAIVHGRPTRKPSLLAAGVCGDAVGAQRTLAPLPVPAAHDASPTAAQRAPGEAQPVADRRRRGPEAAVQAFGQPPAAAAFGASPAEALGSASEAAGAAGNPGGFLWLLVVVAMAAATLALLAGASVPRFAVGAAVARRWPELTFVATTVVLALIALYVLASW